MKLLLLEDDDEMRTHMAGLLLAAGHVVDTCTAGPDAIFMATSTDYGVLILDRMVPDLDGLGKADRSRMVERFKRLDASRNTPGHGLGLSLVNAVAALHRGRLSFRDSNPGLSATLEFPRSDIVPSKLEQEQLRDEK